MRADPGAYAIPTFMALVYGAAQLQGCPAPEPSTPQGGLSGAALVSCAGGGTCSPGLECGYGRTCPRGQCCEVLKSENDAGVSEGTRRVIGPQR